MTQTYSCSANIFPVAKPMMPPPTAANIPSLRPVRAMAGVPRHVATNRAVAMGIWLLSYVKSLFVFDVFSENYGTRPLDQMLGIGLDPS